MVQGVAARLHRQAGRRLRERDAVDRPARRQPVLRRRAGRRRRDGRTARRSSTSTTSASTTTRSRSSRGDVVLDEIRLTRPVLRLERDARGWNLAHLITRAHARSRQAEESAARWKSARSRSATARSTSSRAPSARRASTCPRESSKLDASVGVKTNEDELDDRHRPACRLRAAEPDVGINAMSGVIRRTPERADVRQRRHPHRGERAARQRHRAATSRASRRSSTSRPRPTSSRSTSSRSWFRASRLRTCSRRSSWRRRARPIAMAVDLSLHDAKLGDIKADVTVDAAAPGWRARGTARVDHFNVQALSLRDGVAAACQQHHAATRASIVTLPEGRQPLRGTYAVDIDRVRYCRLRRAQRRRRRPDRRHDGPRQRPRRCLRRSRDGDGHGQSGRAARTGPARPRQRTLTFAICRPCCGRRRSRAICSSATR